MKRALLCLVLISTAAFADEVRAEAPAPRQFALHVGGQVGFPFLLGATARAAFLAPDERPRFTVDVTWEPSASLQSYSVGGGWQVLDSLFFVGGRLRALQFEAPWARGGSPVYFGAGLELGVRFKLGSGGALTLALHGTLVPGQASNLSSLLGLTAGFSWAVFER